MKYCSRCGCQLKDDARYCYRCGKYVDSQRDDKFFDKDYNPEKNPEPVYHEPEEYTYAQSRQTEKKEKSGNGAIVVIVKVILILNCVISFFLCFSLITLIWKIPMTKSYYRKIEEGEKISIGFKICTMIFFSVLGGLFMLFDWEN